MIPQRIKLKGFLCYKDEQEIEFDGNSTLWMLSGLNGSGKSSIFDALTYALFGHHRGGGQHAHELINKDSDSLLVEFDFQLDNRLYRVERHAASQNGRRCRRHAADVLAANQEDGATAWVADRGHGAEEANSMAGSTDNIGLNYDTFTSSVLLLQGKAEKLLDSKPEGRREVLASIVDLERYERLHQKADEERKEFDRDLKILNSRLESLPPVSEEQLNVAQQGIVAAETGRARSAPAVERLQGLEFQAKEWAALQTRLGQARQRWTQAQALLKDASDIEQALDRLRELRETLPHLHQLSNLRSVIHQAQVKITDLVKQRQQLADHREMNENTIKQTRTKRESRQRLLDDDEQALRDNATLLIASTARLEKLREYERQESDVQRIRIELQQLPSDPATLVREARDRSEQLTGVAQTVRLLERFQSKRESLRKAVERERLAQQTQQTIVQRGQEYKAEHEKLKPQLEDATQQTRTALRKRRPRRKRCCKPLAIVCVELTDLGGSHLCRACGQPLTPEHLAAEKRRRSKTMQESEKKAARYPGDSGNGPGRGAASSGTVPAARQETSGRP